MLQQLIHNSSSLLATVALIAMLVVLVVRSASGHSISWSLPRHGRLARWSQARKDGLSEEKARRAFKSHGTVTNVRNHTEASTDYFFNGLSGYTELETTHGPLIVDDLVGPISRGLAVYVNKSGQVRIGGLYSRTFELRRDSPAPAGAAQPEPLQA